MENKKIEVMTMKVERAILDAEYEKGFMDGKRRAYIESILAIFTLVLFLYASKV